MDYKINALNLLFDSYKAYIHKEMDDAGFEYTKMEEELNQDILKKFITKAEKDSGSEGLQLPILTLDVGEGTSSFFETGNNSSTEENMQVDIFLYVENKKDALRILDFIKRKTMLSEFPVEAPDGSVSTKGRGDNSAFNYARFLNNDLVSLGSHKNIFSYSADVNIQVII